MAGVLDRLVYEIGYDVDKGSFDSAKKGISGITTSLKSMAKVAFGAGTALAGFTALVTSQVAETERLAQSVGTTSDITEAFGLEMKKIGLNQENFIDLMEEMNNKMGEMKGLGEFTAVEESLDILNLKFEDLQKLSPEKQFEAITKASLGMADAQKAVTAVDMLMGGEANKLIGSLRAQGLTYEDIIRKQQLYNFQTEESRKGAMRFANSSQDLMALLGSMAKLIASELGTSLTEMVNEFTNWATANKEIIKSGIKEFVSQLTLLLSGLWTVLKTVGKFIGWVADKVGGLTNAFYLFLAIASIGKILAIVKGFVLITRAIMASTIAMRVLGALFSIPALLIGAIALALEDVYNWIVGNESVMGILAGRFDEWLIVMGLIGGRMGEGFKQLGSMILEFLLLPLTAVTSIIDTIIETINSFTGSDIGTIGFNVADFTGQASVLEMGKQAIGYTGQTANNSSTVNNSSQNTANITVNASGNPQEIAVAVQSQLDKNFSSANNSLQPKQK